jgi:hypothetical protein
MGALEYLSNIAVDTARQEPGFQAHPLYVFLNLLIPVLIGLLLSWIVKFVEKGMNLLLGERR